MTSPTLKRIEEIKKRLSEATAAPDAKKIKSDHFVVLCALEEVRLCTGGLTRYTLIDLARTFHNEGFEHGYEYVSTDLRDLVEALEVAIKQRDGFMINYHIVTNVNLADQREIKADCDAKIDEIMGVKG